MDSTYKGPMLTIIVLISCVVAASAEPPVPQGIRPSNILGGAGQHASFSFIRPGLTQTSYAFNGPSSHQAFSSSIGNPNLAQKTLPNVANALAYRNPGLGYFGNGPVNSAYASAPAPPPAPAPAAPSPHYPQGAPPLSGVPQAQVYQRAPTPTQGQADQVAALQTYLQQQYQQQFQQQYQQQYQQALQYQALQNAQAQAQGSPDAAAYQDQLGQLQALRQAQQAQTAQSAPEQLQQQLPEQIQLQQQQQQQQQEQQSQNLLGVAYSSAPSVAHVKVSGNGYNFDF